MHNFALLHEAVRHSGLLPQQLVEENGLPQYCRTYDMGKKKRFAELIYLPLHKSAIISLLFCLLVNLAISQPEKDSILSSDPQFVPYKEAKIAVSRIVRYTGLSPNFVIVPADVSTAVAYIRGGKRYIGYSPDFIQEIKDETHTNWAAVSVLAHEIGHHLAGHTLRAKKSSPGDELEADRFSGFILHKMGATLKQAHAVLNAIELKQDSTRHPPKEARMKAIAFGWRQSQSLTGTMAYQEDEIATPQVMLVYECTFQGDDNLYFITEQDSIIWYDDYGQSIVIGWKQASETTDFVWFYKYGDSTNGVDGKGKIWSEGAHGMRSIIGNAVRIRNEEE